MNTALHLKSGHSLRHVPIEFHRKLGKIIEIIIDKLYEKQ